MTLPIATVTLRFCEECNERISLKRIEAIFKNTGRLPNYCVHCQESFDKRPSVSLDASVVMAEMDIRPLEVEFKRGSKIREFVGRERSAPFVRVPDAVENRA